MGGRGSLSGFSASQNFSKSRAMDVYQKARSAGFSKSEALERVLSAQYQVERMATQGTSRKREITSSTYQRAQKRAQKRVEDFMRRR